MLHPLLWHYLEATNATRQKEEGSTRMCYDSNWGEFKYVVYNNINAISPHHASFQVYPAPFPALLRPSPLSLLVLENV
jgi:hypothetical protein